MCRKDDQARSKQVKRVREAIQSARKEMQSIMTRLDNLQDEVGYLKELEDDSREQRDAMRRLPADYPRLSQVSRGSLRIK